MSLGAPDHVGIFINRITKKLRAEERSSGIAPPEPTELENLVEEIMGLEETADAEMKEDDESVKGKAEKEKAKATYMRLRVFRYNFSEAVPIFSIALKVILSLSDRYKIFTND